MKRLVSIFMALAIMFTAAFAEFPLMTVTAQAASNIGDAEFASKIMDLQGKFKNGEYWNAYNSCGYEGTGKTVCPTASCQAQGFCGDPDNEFICPCKCGAFVLNGVELSWNCLGFACKIGNLIFGGNPLAWTKHTNANNLKPGDMIYGYGLNSDFVHAIYIYEVNGDSIKYADCNATGPDRVRWGATISRATIENALKKSNTYIYHASNNNVSGGTHIHSYQFKYFLEAHPHHDYYECSCGDGYVDNESARYYSEKGCKSCTTFESIAVGTYLIRNKASGQYLTLENNTDANKTNIKTSTLISGDNKAQQFVIYGALIGYKIRPVSSARVINPFGDSGVTTNGMNVNLYDDVNDNTQWWQFRKTDGGYYIHNVANLSCALNSSNYNAVVSTYRGHDYMIWDLVPVNQKYTIAYNANGGTGTMANTEMTVGTAANLRANTFTRSGYTFLGWSTSASATSATYTDKQSVKDLAKSGTVTLYAVWKPNTYTIVYNANGGSGSMANTTMTYGTAANLRANTFTRSGYTFLGWATSASATIATYTDKESVKDLTNSGTVTLYAVWSAFPDFFENELIGFTDTTIEVAWENIPQAHYYIINIQEDRTLVAQNVAEEGCTSYTITGLKPSTLYRIYIDAYDSEYYLRSYGSGIAVTTNPSFVSGFIGTATANSITLKWNKSAGATSYKLQQNVNGAWTTIASPTGTSYTVSGLKSNTAYNFRIFARNGGGQSAQTKLTVTTAAGVPAAVTGFAGTASANSITLKWNRSSGATSYKLQQNVNGAWTTIASPTGTSYTVSGLKANTAYNFRIFARNSAGQSAQTKLTVTTAAGVPATVTGFNGTATANSITLKWNRSSGATSYKLQQNVNGAWTTIASPTGTSYTVSGLKANTAYNFRIFARNDGGQSAQTKLTVTTAAGVPATVTGFNGTATANSITLKWNRSSGATSYKLQQNVNGAWTTIASPTGTSYTVSGLKSNTAYSFRIFPRNSAGQGAQTKLTVSTSAGVPAAVTGFSGAASADSITLKWNRSAGATSYKLQQNVNGAWQTIATPTGTTFIVSGLKAGTVYNFRIFPRNSVGQGEQTKLTVSTIAGIPAAVTGFTGTASADSITLKWNRSAGATSYKLQQNVNGAWTTIASPTGTSYTVSGLKANTAYTFRIFPRNSVGQGTQTKLTVSTVGMPETVTGFMGVASLNSITLKWYESANATEYKLQQMINGAWQTIATPTGTSFTVKNLSANTAYNFRIFARNGSLQSDQIKLTVKTS